MERVPYKMSGWSAYLGHSGNRPRNGGVSPMRFDELTDLPPPGMTNPLIRDRKDQEAESSGETSLLDIQRQHKQATAVSDSVEAHLRRHRGNK